MTPRILHALLAIAVLFLAACSKNNDLSNNDNNTGIGPSPSKVTVETYAGKTIANSINGPGSLCLDENGFLYVAETGHNVVIKVDPLLQTVGHFAGDFNDPGCIDDPFGSGTPSLTFPENLWIGKDMQIYIGDDGCGKAKIANTTGALSSLMYNNPNNLFPSCNAACKDNRGNILIMDTYDGLYEVRAQDQVLVNVMSTEDLGIASSLTTDANGENIYIAANHKIYQYADGNLRPVAGDSLGNKDGVGVKASFGGAMAICTGTDGNIYVADINNRLIRQVTPNGLVTTIAGNGEEGYVDGLGDKAEFGSPRGIAFTTSGDNNILYVSDYQNNVIRKVTFPKK